MKRKTRRHSPPHPSHNSDLTSPSRFQQTATATRVDTEERGLLQLVRNAVDVLPSGQRDAVLMRAL